jgi:hypothetical protein
LTAYHPQTDGQTKCVNQELEQFVHIFMSYKKRTTRMSSSWQLSSCTTTICTPRHSRFRS